MMPYPYGAAFPAADALAVLAMLQHDRPELLLRDDAMPGMACMHLQDRLNHDDILQKLRIGILNTSNKTII